jgi:hypothetical protein
MYFTANIGTISHGEYRYNIAQGISVYSIIAREIFVDIFSAYFLLPPSGMKTICGPMLAQRIPVRGIRAGIFKQSMGARNRVGIGLSYSPPRLHRL